MIKKAIERASAMAIVQAQQPKPDETKVCIKMNTMYVLLDVVERLNLELEHEFKTRNVFKHQVKQTINTIKHNCKNLNDFVTMGIQGYERQESYGEMTDYINEIVRSAILIGEDEDRTRAIALMRNMVFEISNRIRKKTEKYGIENIELHPVKP